MLANSSQRYLEGSTIILLMTAEDEAARRSNLRVNSNHLLLALISNQDPALIHVFRRPTIQLEAIRQQLELELGPTIDSPVTVQHFEAREKMTRLIQEFSQSYRLPENGSETRRSNLIGTLAEKCRKEAHSNIIRDNNIDVVINYAQEEAVRMGSISVHPEHLLLGILSDVSSLASRTLTQHGFDLETIRQMVSEYSDNKRRNTYWQRMSPPAKKLIYKVWEEAGRRNQTHVRPEHFLLVFAQGESPLVTTVLERLDIDLDILQKELELQLGSQPESAISRPPEDELNHPDPRALRERVQGVDEVAKRALSLADDEAQRFGARSIGLEHLLLGIIGEGEGPAFQTLSQMGVDLESARQVVTDVLYQNPPPEEPSG